MAFELTITAPFRFSFTASSRHLSILCGQHERGFVLERQSFAKSGNGKWLEMWRNSYCGTLNVSAPGVLLLVSSWKQRTVAV